MRYLYVRMPKDRYLAALKRKFHNPLYVFDSRVTGMVAGSFFAVAHYQPYEWNRKITGECNRAWGFVKEVSGELEITYIRGKGLLSPGWLLFWTVLCRLFFLLAEIGQDYTVGPIAWLMGAVCALVVCSMSAIGAAITQEGAAGIREVEKFLEDPENYYV